MTAAAQAAQMRITETERRTILDAAGRHFGPEVRVYLFGSRVDDTARGGDIDLYLERVDLDAAAVLERKLGMRAELHAALGEQRIDLVVQRSGGPELPIHVVARRSGVELR